MDACYAVTVRHADAENLLIRALFTCCLAAAMLAAAPRALHAQVDVKENRYDGARSGANLAETTLTTANVNVDKFGKVFSYPVDGAVYAQPLFLSGVTIDGIKRNVVYIATMNDKVYAFDAAGATTAPLWTTDFTDPSHGITAVPMLDIVPGANNIFGNVGIESTPVITRDPKTDATTIYLVARTKEPGLTYVQRLHALDGTTGRDLPGSPVTITGTVAGTALDSTLTPGGQLITFNPKMEHQRAALAVSNGVVLVSWAGHEDKPPYHGWIMGFDATTLARVGIFAVTPDNYEGGIWQGGRAPTLDSDGNAYFATGNGIYDGSRNWGDSLLKFSVSPTTGLQLVDYFTPDNEGFLDGHDLDLSGSGFTLLPGNLLLGGGKEGVLFLLDATKLGHKFASDAQIPQKIPVNGGHVMGGPVFWTSPTQGTLIYNWSEMDVLRAFSLGTRNLTETPLHGLVQSPGHPGGSLTISANGSAANSGIVWASIPTYEDAKHKLTAGTLRAFHAETLQEVWNSDLNRSRDAVGTLIKFVPPLVANGRVYMPTYDNAVAVYGLLPPDFSLSATPPNPQIAAGSSGSVSLAVRAQGTFNAPVALTASGAPAGVTVTFSPSTVIAPGTATMAVALAPGTSTSPFTLTVAGTSGILVHALPITVNGPREIVLFAKDARPAGNWALVSDDTAAYKLKIAQPDAGAAKVPTPAANPVNYFDLSFTAEANVPYHLWIRAKAQNNSYNNDSVYVQFSGSVTDTGVGVNQIGTPTALTVVLEDCTGCGVAEWGWQDNGWGAGVLGPDVYFTGGPQTIRIQQREDGMAIDQIVLSPATYLTMPPGTVKNDHTILYPPTPPTPGTFVLHTATVTTAVHGAWHFVADDTAADGKRIEMPDAGVPKIPAALADPADYFEVTFTAKAGTPYRLWLRGRAQADSYNNDSVYVQFSGSVTNTGAPINRIGSTQATVVVLEDCGGCGVHGWGWQDNGYGTGVLGAPLYFTEGQQTIRIQNREDGMSIDQIVLSSDTYLNTPPGATKDDKTILLSTP
jgi:hypothetical protein